MDSLFFAFKKWWHFIPLCTGPLPWQILQRNTLGTILVSSIPLLMISAYPMFGQLQTTLADITPSFHLGVTHIAELIIFLWMPNYCLMSMTYHSTVISDHCPVTCTWNIQNPTRPIWRFNPLLLGEIWLYFDANNKSGLHM